MPRLKVLSGDEVISIFLFFGFKVASQKGSHIKLKRILENGLKQTLTIPNHQELDRGTLHSIYKQASHYISEQELGLHFYTQ